MIKRLLGSVLLSGLLHACLFYAALESIAWMATHTGPVNIDLGASSLLLKVGHPKANTRPHYAAPAKLWYLAAKGRPIPLPTPPPQNLTVTPQPVEPEFQAAGPPCPPPCPENSDDWASAGSLSVKPAWTDGMITEEDYPASMRRGHKEGVVVVDVLIDAAGKVKGVTLVKGSEPDFDRVVVERLEQSGFDPARDRDGRAVPCRARIPIQFQLQ